MNGFAADLTDDEARRLSNAPGVAGVYEDRVVHLHTTRSPCYLGLNPDSGIWPDTDFGDGVIIGIIDSGIWPERASFNERGLGPVRPTWKGTCVGGERFNASLCNNKLVGAKVFTLSAESASSPRADQRRLPAPFRLPSARANQLFFSPRRSASQRRPLRSSVRPSAIHHRACRSVHQAGRPPFIRPPPAPFIRQAVRR